jgi:hypothetical protein
MTFEDFFKTLSEMIDKYGVVSCRSIAQATPGLSDPTRARYLRRLVKSGVIEARGKSSDRIYLWPQQKKVVG